MKLRAVSIVVLAWIQLGEAALACETPDGDNTLSLKTPLLGDVARLSTGFGMRRDPLLNALKMHTGVDWAAPPGTSVVSASAGRVVGAGVAAEYGQTVVIDHGGGWQTLYAHLASFDVREGDCVEQHVVIGRVGSTGLVAGPSLHFEVRWKGAPIDPLSVLHQGNRLSE